MMFNASEFLKVHEYYNSLNSEKVSDALALVIIDSYCACELPYSNKDIQSMYELADGIIDQQTKTQAICKLNGETSNADAEVYNSGKEIQSVMVGLPEYIGSEPYTIKEAEQYKSILYNYINSEMRDA